MARPGSHPARNADAVVVSDHQAQILRETVPAGRVHVVPLQAGDFIADIRFDEAGFVVDYPGLARRV